MTHATESCRLSAADRSDRALVVAATSSLANRGGRLPPACRRGFASAATMALALLTSTAPTRTQGLRALTSNTNPSAWPLLAMVSPDGRYVYYEFNNAWHLTTWDGTQSVPVPLPQGIWSRPGDAVYGTRTTDVVERVAVPSMALTVVGTVPGLRVLLGTDVTGANLFGVRRTASAILTAFRLPTSGGSAVDLAALPSFSASHAVDATGTTLLATHSPRQYLTELVAIDLGTGATRTIASHMSIPSAVFADNFRSAACVLYDPVLASGRADIALTPVNGTASPVLISNGNAPLAADPAARLLVFAEYNPLAWETPVAVDSRGGGEVFLDAGRWLFLASTSASVNGRIAFVGGEVVGSQFLPPQVYVAELDRELAVSPRPVLGGQGRIDLPLRAGEAGAIAVATALAPPATIPGFVGQLFLDRNLVVVASGVGNGNNQLSVSFTLPNDPILEGRPFFLQGVRIDPLRSRNELTRLAQFVVPYPR